MKKQDQFEKAMDEHNLELVKFLIKDKDVNPSLYNNSYIIKYSKIGEDEIVKILLSDTRVDPTANFNYALHETIDDKYWAKEEYTMQYAKVIELLWADQRVKDSLKKQDKFLYDSLMKEEVEKKVKEF